MRLKNKKLKFLLYVLILVFISILYFFSGTIIGYTEANYDLYLSEPKYILSGELLPEENKFENDLKIKYGVEVKRISNCIVSNYEHYYSKSYNSVICSYLKNKYKKDIIAELFHYQWNVK